MIHHDSRQPGGKLRFSLKLMQMLKRAPIGVLRLIFRIAAVSENSRRQSYAETVMSSNQFSKCLSVAVFCKIYKIPVGIIAGCVQHKPASIRASETAFCLPLRRALARLSIRRSLRVKSSDRKS